MARIVSLDSVDPSVRHYLMGKLRVSDEATVLPQANRSIESGAIKNVVLRLSGSDTGVSPEIFSANWFCGVSLVKMPNEKAEELLNCPEKRARALKALVGCIPSDMQNLPCDVGPSLKGDDQDRDVEQWVAGFDSPGCCAGIYSAMQNKSPELMQAGMSRVHRDHYLAVKAGAGVAGQTFHARLCAALRDGKSLDDALCEGGTPGAGALRRVASAAKRNRARVLLLAAEAVGFYGIDTLGDNASPVQAPHRVAIPEIEAVYNAITKADTSHVARSTWTYSAGACDSSVSTGIVISSNVAEGFTVFVGEGGERLVLKNESYNCVPFATPRILCNRDAVFKAVEAHKKSKNSEGESVHPDGEWIKKRFGWSSKDFGNSVDIEPPGVWGSHQSENFVSEWGRELGISRLAQFRLQPEIVSISAVEPGKLRVASKAVCEWQFARRQVAGACSPPDVANGE